VGDIVIPALQAGGRSWAMSSSVDRSVTRDDRWTREGLITVTLDQQLYLQGFRRSCSVLSKRYGFAVFPSTRVPTW
jgi:hypothetical protein